MSVRQTKIIAQVKESFLVLCQQYASQGKLLEALAHHIKQDTADGYMVPVGLRMARQHDEIAEQLKTLGSAIDLLGGGSVMTGAPAVRVISGTRTELKARGIHVPREW